MSTVTSDEDLSLTIPLTSDILGPDIRKNLKRIIEQYVINKVWTNRYVLKINTDLDNIEYPLISLGRTIDNNLSLPITLNVRFLHINVNDVFESRIFIKNKGVYVNEDENGEGEYILGILNPRSYKTIIDDTINVNNSVSIKHRSKVNVRITQILNSEGQSKVICKCDLVLDD